MGGNYNRIGGFVLVIDTKTRIKLAEGFSPTLYKDSLGYATIGFGHLVTDDDNFQEGVIYSPEELEGVFNQDYNIAKNDAQSIIDNELNGLNGYSEKQKEIIESVLIDMCFNLGKPRLLKFKNFLQALRDKDVKKAKAEMLDSRWAVQVKSRAIELSDMIGKL